MRKCQTVAGRAVFRQFLAILPGAGHAGGTVGAAINIKFNLRLINAKSQANLTSFNLLKRITDFFLRIVPCASLSSFFVIIIITFVALFSNLI